MMQPNNFQNKYLETQVQTASPVQLINMLYDGAVKFAHLAIAGIRENDIAKKTTNIIKVEKIIIELRNSLNFNQGGEIAKNLDKIYDYMYTTLMDANDQNDTSKIESVIKEILIIKDGWQAVLRDYATGFNKQAPSAQPAPAYSRPAGYGQGGGGPSAAQTPKPAYGNQNPIQGLNLSC
ncbi:MAG: flagellar export chaperone FliS [Candidatus Wallbacteria bacterium]